MYTYTVKVRLRKLGSIGEWYSRTFQMSFARKMTEVELRHAWYNEHGETYEVFRFEHFSHWDNFDLTNPANTV